MHFYHAWLHPFYTTTSVPCMQYLVCVAIDPSNTIMILLSLVSRPFQEGPGYEARYCYAICTSTMQWTILACNIMYTLPYHGVHVLAVTMQYAIPSCSITIPPTLISIDSETYSCAMYTIWYLPLPCNNICNMQYHFLTTIHKYYTCSMTWRCSLCWLVSRARPLEVFPQRHARSRYGLG